MKVVTRSGNHEYDIVIGRGILQNASKEFDLDRKVMIVSDQGVPHEYIEKIMNQCAEPYTAIIASGEDSKSLDNFSRIQRALVYRGFTRKDCIVALGGGVPGDLAGFSAASYMRGIDFYNIPTTVLSQVDSSIGGKTAINFMGLKNILGAFYQPRKVLIDIDTLKSLPGRQVNAGLAEVVKAAAIMDAGLFEMFENEDVYENIDTLIERALSIKKSVVEQDEKEADLRRVLNFGHTIGHGIEVSSGEGKYLHGECVALGMLPMCSENVRRRLLAIYEKLSLPSTCKCDVETAMQAISHDKKSHGDVITTVYVDTPGSFEFRDLTLDVLKEKLLTLIG